MYKKGGGGSAFSHRQHNGQPNPRGHRHLGSGPEKATGRTIDDVNWWRGLHSVLWTRNKCSSLSVVLVSISSGDWFMDSFSLLRNRKRGGTGCHGLMCFNLNFSPMFMKLNECIILMKRVVCLLPIVSKAAKDEMWPIHLMSSHWWRGRNTFKIELSVSKNKLGYLSKPSDCKINNCQMKSSQICANVALVCLWTDQFNSCFRKLIIWYTRRPPPHLVSNTSAPSITKYYFRCEWKCSFNFCGIPKMILS